MISYERLCTTVEEKNWPLFIDLLKPKYFVRDENGILIDRKFLSKVAEMLTAFDSGIPRNVTILLLKCLVNSCIDGYKYEKCSEENVQLSKDYCHHLYKSLSTVNYPNENTASFPYYGIVEWAVDYILKYDENFKDPKNCPEILRLSIRFLCNLSTFACKPSDLPHFLSSTDFKSEIITLAGSDDIFVATAACAFVHNALKNLPENYYTDEELKSLPQILIEADMLEILSALDSLVLLIKRAKFLRTIYEDLSFRSKLALLGIIYWEVRKSVYSESNNDMSTNFSSDVVEFISERFRKRSDLILKTVDSYLDGTEPEEITVLLDIIGVISSKDSVECRILQNDKSLIINCIFLLKSLHMAGKASKNYFTPLQKSNEIAPCNTKVAHSSKEENIQSHPAFGFKAGLIRAIGNLVHKHKSNQELLRETDTIPLLLDCCNIDARNPLIIQWTIFALRNLCENNPENQEIIRNCNKVGVVDSDIIREMGMKLHEDEDGKAIGILPLPTK